MTQEHEENNPLYHEAQDRLALLPNYYRWICSHFLEHLSGTVLELGSGAGHVIREYIRHVEKVIAVDYNDMLLDRLKERYPEEKVHVVRADLKGEWLEMEDVCADVIIALDVIEHFEDDKQFVDKLKSKIKPGGKVVIKVPAQPHLFSEMDIASGHFRRYDKNKLKALMESAGFTTISLRFMNPLGAWAYRVKNNKKSTFSKTFSPTKLKIINIIIPVISVLDKIPGLKGLSLVGIFQK